MREWTDKIGGIKNMPVTASVILSCYDIPRSLHFSLLGYTRQSFQDFEVVIADDGSGSDTRELIENFKKESPFPIKHVWQENKGFRKAKIVNEGVRVSEGRILILTDGDCIPHKDFVKVHVDSHRENSFATGGYVMMPLEYCNNLTAELVLMGDYERHLTLDWKLYFTKIHIRNIFRKIFNRKRWPKAVGSNISVCRGAFYAVNGYDENYDGFTLEDSDLRNRLITYRAKAISLWSRVFVFHIDHSSEPTRQSHPPRDGNKEYEYHVLRHRGEVHFRCKNGLVKESL